MAISAGKEKQSSSEYLPYGKKHYRELKRRNIIRLVLTYSLPLILLSIYFYFQYEAIISESKRLHLKAIAENQANTLNLFLTERVVNLANLIDDPRFEIPPSSPAMQDYLRELKKNSETFVDIGFFDSSGVQTAYAGPYPSLEKRNYATESWYITLKQSPEYYIITDIYLGFRNEPHFTIAVNRDIDNQYVVLRATLSPEKMYDYIRTLGGANEVYTSIVNTEGQYQLVTPHIGTMLESSSLVPPPEPSIGAEKVKLEGVSLDYAYSWLKTANWALIVQSSNKETDGIFSDFRFTILASSLAIVLLTFAIILNRAGKLVEMQKEADRTRAQLEHAAKLASVGELASGIAHEINNPLAIINEEAGLIKDLLNPEFGEPLNNEELVTRLSTIQGAAFRARDITRKLLGFVRKTDVVLQTHDIHKVVDSVVDGLLGQELAVSNVKIVKDYTSGLPQILTDGNQLQQVILNIIKNGVDALENKPGTITLATSRENNTVRIAITDTGIGMGPDQLDKIFMPFHTTKQVGKGTGLGLSVSYGIMKSLGGRIDVESVLGEGSTFTIVLPVNWHPK